MPFFSTTLPLPFLLLRCSLLQALLRAKDAEVSAAKSEAASGAVRPSCRLLLLLCVLCIQYMHLLLLLLPAAGAAAC
jgi:hypothetical protein